MNIDFPSILKRQQARCTQAHPSKLIDALRETDPQLWVESYLRYAGKEDISAAQGVPEGVFVR